MLNDKKCGQSSPAVNGLGILVGINNYVHKYVKRIYTYTYVYVASFTYIVKNYIYIVYSVSSYGDE